MADHINENLPAPIADDGRDHVVPQQPGAAHPMPSLQAPDEANAGVPWGRYLAALRRYKWLILVVTTLGTAGAVVASRFIKPVYTVTATIWIQTSSRPGVQSGGLLQSYAWQELLGTNVVLDSVAHKLRLYLAPQTAADSVIFGEFGILDRMRPGRYQLRVSPNGSSYVLLNAADDTLESGVVGDSIGLDLGFGWAPEATLLRAGRTIGFTVITPREAASQIRSQMTSTTCGAGFPSPGPMNASAASRATSAESSRERPRAVASVTAAGSCRKPR